MVVYWSSNIKVNTLAETKKVSEMSSEEIKDAVKETYTKVAAPAGGGCCGPTETQKDPTTDKDDSSNTV
jgi:hypothetical protein